MKELYKNILYKCFVWFISQCCTYQIFYKKEEVEVDLNLGRKFVPKLFWENESG